LGGTIEGRYLVVFFIYKGPSAALPTFMTKKKHPDPIPEEFLNYDAAADVLE